MTFISLDYLLLFLPLVVGLYLFCRGTILANLVILAASYYFYAATAAWYLIPLVITSLLDFVVGLFLSRETRPVYRRALLIASLAANLGLLGFFKYTPWLIDNMNLGLAALGVGAVLPTLRMASSLIGIVEGVAARPLALDQDLTAADLPARATCRSFCIRPAWRQHAAALQRIPVEPSNVIGQFRR